MKRPLNIPTGSKCIRAQTQEQGGVLGKMTRGLSTKPDESPCDTRLQLVLQSAQAIQADAIP